MTPEQCLKKYSESCELIEYWEKEGEKETIIYENKGLKAFAKSSSKGISARALVNGCFGYASSNDCKNPESAFKKAYALAKAASKAKSEKTKIKEFEINRAKIKPGAKINPFQIDDSKKISYLKDFNSLFSLKEIKHSQSTMGFSKSKSLYMNSLGSKVLQESIYSQLFSEILAGNESNHEIIRAKKGYELFKNFPINLAKKSEEKIKRLLDSKQAKPGKYDIIIDPELSGTFFHEAVGHALEADGIKEKSTCVSMNEKIGTDELTIYDNPTLRDYWGSYEYDDEGIKAKKSLLVQSGIAKNFINDLTSYFSSDGLKKTANGRMQSIHDLPIPRMSNTQIKPGKYSKQEIIEKIKNGLLVTGFKGGAVDTSTGIFSFKATEAFEIKSGKITQSFKGASLNGDLKEVLKKIIAIGKDGPSPYRGGTCGKKGQHVPVSEKVPYIGVKQINVGN